MNGRAVLEVSIVMMNMHDTRAYVLNKCSFYIQTSKIVRISEGFIHRLLDTSFIITLLLQTGLVKQILHIFRKGRCGMSYRIRRSVILGLIAVSLVVSGASVFAGGTRQQATAVNRVRVGLAPPEVETNRFWMGTPGNMQQYEPVLETLIGNDPVTNELRPKLAERWESNADFTEWTFYLRRGVQFHSGFGEFTAADVLHTWTLLGSEGSRIDMRGRIAGVEALDDYTVRFRLHQPDPDAAVVFSRASASSVFYVTSKAQWDATGEAGMEQQLIGTGPFLFKERNLGENLVFERAPSHWRGDTPQFDTLEFRWVPEQSTRLAMLLAGEVDMASLGRDLANDAVSAGMSLVQAEIENMQVAVLLVGPWLQPKGDVPAAQRQSALGDIRVRQALNHAVDRDEIRETIYQGRAVELPLFGAFRDNIGWDPAFENRFDELYGFNPQRARQLLAEVGYGPGQLEITIHAYPLAGQPEMFDLADALYTYFTNVGINATIRDYDSYGAFLPRRDNGEVYGDVYIMRNTPIRPPREAIAGMYLRSGWAQVYNSDFIEERYARFMATFNPAQRDALARDVFRAAFDSFASIPIASTFSEFAVNPNVIRGWTWPAQTPTITSHWYMLEVAR